MLYQLVREITQTKLKVDQVTLKDVHELDPLLTEE